MKQNNNNRRARGRGPRKPHGMGGGHGKGQGFDNPGHETRVRGNAYQVLEKYLQLARDAGSAGDRVAAENFLQHADHYYRVLSAMNEGQRPRMGGRELSVADVNVQNVSQGLSAAMYGSGGSNSQGLPGMGSDPNQPGDDGQENRGQEQRGQERQGQGHQAHQGQHQRQGHGQHGQQSHAQGQGQGHGQGHGQGQGQGRGHPQHQGHQAAAAPSGNIAAANGHNGGYPELAEQPAAVYAAPEPVQVSRPPDDQPDYPEELLPTVAPAADAAPEATPDVSGRPPRGPRGRLRGPGRRGPRQPEHGPDAAQSGGDGGSDSTE